MNDAEDRLAQCFLLALPVLDRASVKDASMATVAAWESLTTVNLMSLIEEEFEISIPAEAIAEFTSFARVLAVVGRLTDPARPA